MPGDVRRACHLDDAGLVVVVGIAVVEEPAVLGQQPTCVLARREARLPAQGAVPAGRLDRSGGTSDRLALLGFRDAGVFLLPPAKRRNHVAGGHAVNAASSSQTSLFRSRSASAHEAHADLELDAHHPAHVRNMAFSRPPAHGGSGAAAL